MEDFYCSRTTQETRSRFIGCSRACADCGLYQCLDLDGNPMRALLGTDFRIESHPWFSTIPKLNHKRLPESLARQ
jgi:hypothetical protein